METVNKLILLAIACNLFIFVGIGHSALPMGLVEPTFLVDAIKGDTALALTGGYSVRVTGCVLLSMLGQICLLIACFLNRPMKPYFTYFGISLLLLALLFLTIDFSSGHSDTFTLFFAIPFIYASIRLLIYLLRAKSETPSENYSR
jgi:hypothetical protein